MSRTNTSMTLVKELQTTYPNATSTMS